MLYGFYLVTVSINERLMRLLFIYFFPLSCKNITVQRASKTVKFPSWCKLFPLLLDVVMYE
mgnify:CR=1 FL=1